MLFCASCAMRSHWKSNGDASSGPTLVQARTAKSHAYCLAHNHLVLRYGRGEGFAVAVLALPSSDVSGGSHTPAAVIVASAVNQDGRSSGLTAPNGPAQTRLVAGATESSGYSPADTKLVRILAVRNIGIGFKSSLETVTRSGVCMQRTPWPWQLSHDVVYIMDRLTKVFGVCGCTLHKHVTA